MTRLDTYKMLSKKVNRYVKMINHSATLNNYENAQWYYVRIMNLLEQYYKYEKISFQAKVFFINRIIYNTNFQNYLIKQ